MRLTWFVGLISLSAIGLAVSSCVSSAPSFLETDRFLTNVTVIDVTDGSALNDQTIIVRGDRIFEISPSEDVRLPEGASILVTGGYAVPGLWDMHVHTMTDPDAALEYFFPLFLANGVTGIRDMGSVVDGIVETRSRVAEDASIFSPHLYVSGPLLDGQKLPWYGDLPLVLKTAEDVDRELPKLKAAGMDFLKVYDALPESTYDAVVAFGAENDLPIAGHTPKGVNLTGAGLAKQRSAEHLSPFGFRDCLAEPDMWFQRAINAKFGEGFQAYYEVTQELFEALDRDACKSAFETMAAGGTRFTPTLVMELNDRSRIPEQDLQYLQPVGREWCETGLSGIDQADPVLRETVFAGYAKLLNEMREADVIIIAGSDVPNNCLVPGFSLHWELERLVEVGLTPLEALQSATVHAAKAMDRGDEMGQIAPGYFADILVLDQNPLQDVAHLREFKGIMASGRWIADAERVLIMDDVGEYLASQELLNEQAN